MVINLEKGKFYGELGEEIYYYDGVFFQSPSNGPGLTPVNDVTYSIHDEYNIDVRGFVEIDPNEYLMISRNRLSNLEKFVEKYTNEIKSVSELPGENDSRFPNGLYGPEISTNPGPRPEKRY